MYTKYACVGSPIVTNSSLNCSWETDDNYLFDLSSLYGSMIEFNNDSISDDIGDNFKYFYTPCNDGMICIQSDNNEYVTNEAMITQINEYGQCVSYLALFDASVQPQYYSDSQSFVFTYVNGETEWIKGIDLLLIKSGNYSDSYNYDKKNSNQYESPCQSGRQTLVEWRCEKNVDNGLFEAVYVNEVVSCVYHALISSPLACVTNSTMYS